MSWSLQSTVAPLTPILSFLLILRSTWPWQKQTFTAKAYSSSRFLLNVNSGQAIFQILGTLICIIRINWLFWHVNLVQGILPTDKHSVWIGILLEHSLNFLSLQKTRSFILLGFSPTQTCANGKIKVFFNNCWSHQQSVFDCRVSRPVQEWME